ncbi:MAG: hypothetical protein Q9174_005771 [Haloplaca sp. 1 TL-2023]
MARHQGFQIEIKRFSKKGERLEIHLPNAIIRARVPLLGQTIVAPVQDTAILDLDLRTRQAVQVKDGDGDVVFQYEPVDWVKKGFVTGALRQVERERKNLEEEEEKRRPAGHWKYETKDLEAGKRKGEEILKSTPNTPQNRGNLTITPNTSGSKTHRPRSLSRTLVDPEKTPSRSSSPGQSFHTPAYPVSDNLAFTAAMNLVQSRTTMERSPSMSRLTPVERSGRKMGKGIDPGSVTPTKKGKSEAGESGKKSSMMRSSEGHHFRLDDKESIEASPSAGRKRKSTVSRPNDGEAEPSIARAKKEFEEKYPPVTEGRGTVARKSSSLYSSTSVSKPASNIGTAAAPVETSALPYRDSVGSNKSCTSRHVETTATQTPKPGSYLAKQGWKPPYRGINDYRAKNMKAAEENKTRVDRKGKDTQANKTVNKAKNQGPEKDRDSKHKQKDEKKSMTFLKRTANTLSSPVSTMFGFGGPPKSPRIPEPKRGRFDDVPEADEGGYGTLGKVEKKEVGDGKDEQKSKKKEEKNKKKER